MGKLSDSPSFKALASRVDTLSGASTLAAYGTLAQAVAAINANGATPATELVINAPTTVAANTTVPANIILKPEGNCLIIVNAGVTLTIGAMRAPGNRQIFAGGGRKIFAKNAVSLINLQWYVARTEFADITAAMNDALLSCRNYENGGQVMIPTGNWLSSGGHEVYNYTNVFGVGNSRIYFAQSNTTMFTVLGTGGRHSINFDSFILNGYYQNQKKTGVRGIVGNADGGQIYLLSCKRLRFEVVETSMMHQSSTNGEGIVWSFEDCATSDGGVAFRCESINSSQIFTNCRFHVDTNGTIFDLKYTGGFEAKNCLFISVPNPTGGLPNSGATVIKTFGAHNNIKVTSCQDESVEYFLKTAANNYLQGLFVFTDNLIQSKIQPSADTTVYSRTNKYVWDSSGNYKGNIGSAALIVYSDDDQFVNRVGDTPEVISDTVGQFTGNSRVARQVSRFSNTNKFGGTTYLDALVVKSPTGAMRKLILNDDGTISNAAL